MNLQESILQTIVFFDLFDFPLTAEEIHEHLFDYPKKVHIKEIKGTLNEMEGVLSHVHDYYTLKGREQLVDTRKARKFIAEKLWGRTRQYGQYITKIPFVKMVAVCNNLAYDNASEQSDIDLFIVIDEGRMWTARLLITTILHFFGVRRYGDKVAGRFCLSFFATPQALDMEKIKIQPNDPYLAYWTKLLTPIYGEETYKEFRKKNEKWIKEHYNLEFPDEEKKKVSFTHHHKLKRFFEWLLKGKLGHAVEGLIKKIFKKRTLKKAENLDEKAHVIIKDTMLKFHNHDRRKDFYENWEKTVERIKKELEEHNQQSEKTEVDGEEDDL